MNTSTAWMKSTPIGHGSHVVPSGMSRSDCQQQREAECRPPEEAQERVHPDEPQHEPVEAEEREEDAIDETADSPASGASSGERLGDGCSKRA
jgi:hypothetical protein